MKMKNLAFTIFILIFMMGCSGLDTGSLTIGGYVTREDGSPVQGVEIAILWPDLKSDPLKLVTDEEGWYSYEYSEIFEEDRVTITPSYTGYIFSPAMYDLKSVKRDNLGLDFFALPNS